MLKYDNKKLLLMLILLIFPFSFIVLKINSLISYHFYLDSDPDYVYLLNSLLILKGQSVGHSDHPGTTLQLIGSIVVFFKYIFSASSLAHFNLLTDVLLSPESYMQIINFICVIITSFSLYFIGYSFFKLSKSILYSLLLQAYILTCNSLFYLFYKVSAESILFPSILIFISFIFLFLNHQSTITNTDRNKTLYRDKHNPLLASLVGASFAFGMATKINFFPMIIFYFIFKEKKDKIFFFLSTLISFLIITIPVNKYYVLKWAVKLTIFNETYGHGQKTVFPSLSILKENVLSIIKNDIFLTVNIFAVILFYFLYFFYKKGILHNFFHLNLENMKKSQERETKIHSNLLSNFFIPLSILVNIAGIIIVIKHFNFRYLLPFQLLSTISITAILYLIGLKINKKLYQYFSFLLLLFLTSISFKNYAYTKNNIQQRVSSVNDANNFIEKNYSGCTIITYYQSPLKSAGFLFGEMNAKGFFKPYLINLYEKKELIYYNIWSEKFEIAEENYPDNKLVDFFKKQECLLMYGQNGYFKKSNVLFKSKDISFIANEIYTNELYSVYSIKIENKK